MRSKPTPLVRAGQGQSQGQKHEIRHESFRSTEERCPEWARPRRSAVDREILSYLGALAKRDPEGFVYPRPVRVARKVQRTPHYVAHRIRFLEGIGRIVPAVRVRHGREVRGWLVIRYRDWVATQDQAMASDATRDLERPSDCFVHASNNSFLSKGKNDPNQQETQAPTAKAGRGSSGFEDSKPTRATAKRSQSTLTATATARGGSSFPKRQKEETLADRIARKIERKGWSLRDALLKSTEDDTWLLEEVREVCAFLDFPFDQDNPTITLGFCFDLLGVWDAQKDKLRSGQMKRSVFCSKVIDRCVESSELWPPSFTNHRDKLARSEKAACIEE